jgi:hypothetical protein
MYSTICPKCWDDRGEGAIVPGRESAPAPTADCCPSSTLHLFVVAAASVLMRTKGNIKMLEEREVKGEKATMMRWGKERDVDLAALAKRNGMIVFLYICWALGHGHPRNPLVKQTCCDHRHDNRIS